MSEFFCTANQWWWWEEKIRLSLFGVKDFRERVKLWKIIVSTGRKESLAFCWRWMYNSTHTPLLKVCCSLWKTKQNPDTQLDHCHRSTVTRTRTIISTGEAHVPRYCQLIMAHYSFISMHCIMCGQIKLSCDWTKPHTAACYCSVPQSSSVVQKLLKTHISLYFHELGLFWPVVLHQGSRL